MKRAYGYAAVGGLVVAAFVGAQLVSGAGTGTPSAFVPMVPCRLMDTRPAPETIGSRATPLGPDETVVVDVHGANGDCTGDLAIPATATAVAMNVTTVNGTAASFLTLWPSDAAEQPDASNLNWLAGAPATPNKVDVQLSADGTVSIFNKNGTVDVIADVVGYYQPESAGGAPGPAGPAGPDRSPTVPAGPPAPGPAGPAGPAGAAWC